MTEIQVPGPNDEPTPEEPEEEAPYNSLFVPLIVVPAMIVMVLVLVFVLFGAIAGDEASARENLLTIQGGGSNERTQAAFGLVRQTLEDLEARQEGSDAEPEWGFFEPAFQDQVRAVWDNTAEDDYWVRFVLAIMLHSFGDPAGVEGMGAMLAMPDEVDPDGEMRFALINSLGEIGDPGAAELVIPFLDHPDAGLGQIAAIALQNMPGEATIEALRGALGRGDLVLRAAAAVSLSHLGDPAGAPMLRELLDPAAYTLDREAHPARWTRAELVERTRVQAVEALARLGLAEDRSRFEALAEDDDSPLVREAAMRARDAASSGSAE